MSSKLHYSSIGKTIDGTTFCSGVETLADNLIEDNELDATITVPSKTGWLTVKSADYRVTTENACIILPQDIYKIRKVYLRAGSFLRFSAYIENNAAVGPAWYKGNTNEGFYPFNNYIPVDKCYIADTGELWDGCIDITYLVKTAEEFATLEIVAAGDVNNSINKNNTMYYNQGTKEIRFGEMSQRLFLSGRANIITLILKYIHDFNVRSKNAENLDFDRKLYTYVNNGNVVSEGEGTQIYSSDSIHITTDQAQLETLEIRELLFRIEYIPMFSKTKIRARKNASTKQEYIQPFNQRAEINAASAFGKNMYLTAQKTGCREITIVKNYTRLKDIPPLGALVRHNGKRYRLVANHYVQTNIVYIQVTHTLSENWSERSKHVAVDQKYRNWSIPQDTLWRNLYWEDYLRVGTSPKTSADVSGGVSLANIMRGLYVEINEDKTVDTFAWLTSEGLGTANGMEVTGATVPCSTYGIANSLIFSASFKDNLSAGLRAIKWGEENTTTKAIEYLCEEALYCKSDGTLDKASVVLGEGVSNYNSVVYPSVCGDTNTVENEVFNKEFYIYKDAGEALKFTYQIHLIGEDDCFFGNKFAEHNPLIKKWNVNRKFKVWALTHYVREGSDILETVTGDKAFDHVIDNLVSGADKAKFSIYQETSYDTSEYGEVYTIRLLYTFFDELNKGGYRSWAITDENNNLYVACNDVSVRRLYFQLHHKR